MSDYIDTREGWRRMLAWETADGRDMLQYEPNGDPEKAELWVREAPLPPLPTAPYTVIRVTSTSGMESILIRNELGWYEIDDMSAPVEQPKTGWSFEVLSEPRAVTAKAVLRRVVSGGITTSEDSELLTIAREFGVES